MVSSEDGPLPGATVLVQGTNAGTSTDFDGNFSINAESGDVLVISFVGFATQQITVSGQDQINVTLIADQALEEVVVTGYGSQREREITSAVVKVDSEEFNQGPVTDAVQLLQGKVAGLSIYKPGGNPNENAAIRIRGLSTLGANTSPLVVIDGVPGATLANVDPQDIESVTVLKDGEYVGTFDQENVDVDFLVSKMLGKDLENEKFNNQVNQNKEKVLSIKKLSGEGFSDISFDLHKGEILTLTGLSGAGRTELAYSLFGFIPSKSGEIFVNNKKTIIDSTSKAIKNGIGYLSENRKELGLFTGMEYRENIESNNLEKFSKNFIINKLKRDSVSEDLKIKFDIKIPKIDHLVLNLSGGNQQKVSISKWIYANLKILIVDEPTIGVDVGAKFSIYKILKEITSEGVSVLMISSDINETLNISDRIIVMFDGKISGILNADEANEEKILKMASGIDNE